MATRRDDTVCFEVPPTSAYVTDPTQADGDAVVDASLLDAVRAATGDVDVRGRRASVGRGAEGFGAAVEVVVTFGGVGGAVMTLEWVATKARKAYSAVRRHLGRRPTVSLGAAQFLAAADLIDRLGHSRFTLASSGEVDPNVPDLSFTGDDTFWIILSDFPHLYVYIVTVTGRVHYLGTHEIRAGAGSRLHHFPGPNGRFAEPEVEDD